MHDTAQGMADMTYEDMLAAGVGVEAPDDYTLVFTCKNPYFACLPCIFGFNIWSDFNILGKGVLDLEDFVVSNLLLPIGAMVYLLFCTTKFGWGFDNYFEECNTGKGLKLSRVLKPYLKYALPVLIVIVFVQGFIG